MGDALETMLDRHARDLNPRSILAYLVIAAELEAGRPMPSVYYLARKLHVEVRMVRRYLAELRDVGALERSALHVVRLPHIEMTAVAR